MTERHAENLACRTLSLAEHIVSSTEQNTPENQDEVAAASTRFQSNHVYAERSRRRVSRESRRVIHAFVGVCESPEQIENRRAWSQLLLDVPLGSEIVHGRYRRRVSLSSEEQIAQRKISVRRHDAVVEHDPELLVLSGLEEAVEELLSLWTAEASRSLTITTFSKEELSVAESVRAKRWRFAGDVFLMNN